MRTTIANNQTSLEIPLLKSLLLNEGIKVKNEIRSFTTNEFKGFFCLASSVIRKTTTVKQLVQFIIDNNLPLTVEIGSDFNCQFKIFIKEETPAISITDKKFSLSIAINYLSMAEICDNEINKGNDLDWWKAKKIYCLTMYQTISNTA